MADRPQWYPEAALAGLCLMSLLFTGAGLANLLGLFDIELSYFGIQVETTQGNVLWVLVSLLFAGFFGFFLRKRLATKTSVSEPKG